MLAFNRDAALLVDTLIAVVGLIILINNVKIHPFVSLVLASGFIGLATRMPLGDIPQAFQKGFGDVLGFVGVIIGLGTMLGKLMAVSGGADQIARTLIRAFIVGIPLFFEVGFVLLIPLMFTVAKRVNVPLLKIGIPLVAGLSVVHGLVPPHPASLIAIDAFKADIGRTIFYGLLVGFPTAIIAGPIFGAYIARSIDTHPSQALADQLAQGPIAVLLDLEPSESAATHSREAVRKLAHSMQQREKFSRQNEEKNPVRKDAIVVNLALKD